MKLITIGTSHGATEKGRCCSANLIDVGGKYYLFDCGGAVELFMKNNNMPFENLKAVFISHMHEDHVGTLSSIAKRFLVYHKNSFVRMYLPEQNGINAFKNWLAALHIPPKDDNLQIDLINGGKIFKDETITVTAMPTLHIEHGKFPSFAFKIEAEGKKILYTGDLDYDFRDYPGLIANESYDLILSELVHFDLEKNLPEVLKSKTKKIVFTHGSNRKIEYINANRDIFPFNVELARDGQEFII